MPQTFPEPVQVSGRSVPSYNHSLSQRSRNGLLLGPAAQSRSAVKRSKRNLWFLRLEAWVDRLLLKLEVLKRKHPKVFRLGSLGLVLVNEGLYVYDLYTDVIVVQFFLENSYMFAFFLSILFILWHYVALSALLTYFMRDFLLDIIRPDEEDMIRAKAKAREMERMNNSWFSSTLGGVSSTPILNSIIFAPALFCITFLISCIVVPVIDILMLGFDLVAYFAPPKSGDDANPLNNSFINFLLQYRTLRVPMEVVMQSLPQAILLMFMYTYIQDHPPTHDNGGESNFHTAAVIESLVASVANMTVNGINIYLATKISGRTWLRYMVMALKFEGSAQLPPEWDERTTAVHTVIEGNYHALKLAQQMKILQVAVRRETIFLRSPGPLAAHPEAWSSDLSGAAASSLGSIVLEHRKMIEFLYEWDTTNHQRRMPAKIEEANDAKDAGARVDVLLQRVHEIPPTAVNDLGDDMEIPQDQLQANMEYASTEQVCMWLISHHQVVDSLVHVRLNDCNLDASFMLRSEFMVDGPIILLLRSTSMKLLDLANNPLFELIREQQSAVDPEEHGTASVRGTSHRQGGNESRLNQSRQHDEHEMGTRHRTAPPFSMFGWLAQRQNHVARTSTSGQFARDNQVDASNRQEWNLESAVKAFAEAIKTNNSLETLNLSETKMCTEAVTELMRVLRAPWSASADDKECNTSLQMLDISHNHLLKELKVKRTEEEQAAYVQKMEDAAEDLASSLATLQGLKELNMSCTFLNIKQLEVLARGLIANKTLTKVDLSNMDISGGKAEGAKVLASVLQKNHTLQSLVLQSVNMSELGTEFLSDALTSNSALVSLDLSSNSKNNVKIGDQGAEHLAKAFQNWRRPFEGGLQDLFLSGIELNCSGVVQLCGGLACMGSLRALDLSKSHLDHDLGESSITPEMRIQNTVKAARAIGSVLKSNPGLGFLSLAHCHISTRGAEALANQLEEARFSNDVLGLEYLDLSNNPLGTDGVFRVLQSLQDGYPWLTTISLSAVNMTSDGFNELLELFEGNNALLELDVTHNFIQNVKLEALDRFNKSNYRLRRIDLRWNRIPDRLCSMLAEAFTQRGQLEAERMLPQRFSAKLADFFSLEEGTQEAPYVLLV